MADLAHDASGPASSEPAGFAPQQTGRPASSDDRGKLRVFISYSRDDLDFADQLRSSCPTAVPQSPVERVDTVKARLNTIVEGTRSIRPDLENFYASLSDGQKARFNVMGPLPNSASSQPER